ncbi:uncharacterized protein [Diadema antillarum]|uniref:uncharacterized protein n=1 Tax=Diadema antillarum TaxID=105358 RepID=UPI003A847F84
MIRSLAPSDRRKWPELISNIVFLYNSTPHRVTGMSPYKLLFGRETYTPLDQLLSNVELTWDEDFVAQQAKALKCAHECAKKHIEQSQQRQKERNNVQTISKSLTVGSRVLLKQCAFDGRHKLEDKFHRSPFIVMDVNAHQDVYAIRPLLGGPTKWVNRKLLIEDPREGLPQIEENEAMSTYEGDVTVEACGEGSSDDTSDTHDLWESRKGLEVLSLKEDEFFPWVSGKKYFRVTPVLLTDAAEVVFEHESRQMKFCTRFNEMEHRELEFLRPKYELEVPAPRGEARGIALSKKAKILQKLTPKMPESRRTFWKDLPESANARNLSTFAE